MKVNATGPFLCTRSVLGGMKERDFGRIITVAYYALVNLSDHQVRAATDARSAAWFSVADLPVLAFDHEHIVQVALGDVPHGSIAYQTIFAAGLTLALVTLFFNVMGYLLRKRFRQAY